MPPSISSTGIVTSPFVLIIITSGALACARPCGTSRPSPSTSAGTGRRWRSRCRRRRISRPSTISHLESNNTAKRAGSIIISNLHEAHARLPVDLARAGRARGDRKRDVEVLVHVGGALGDDARGLEQRPDVRLLGDAARAVAVVAGHVGRRLRHGTVGEGACCGRVDDRLDRAASVGGHDVEDACDLVLDLGEGAAAGEFLFVAL